MRFSPSSNWSLITASANKVVGWTTYIRTVTNLSGSNSGIGGWLNVSGLTVPPVPDQTTSIEKDFLEFSSSSVSIVAMNISWWASQMFTPADRKDATKFFEFKIVCTLSSGSILASDECITFAGWVNKDSIQFNETDDSVLFDVMSYDDMATLMPAEAITTQYINKTVDGLVGTSLLGLYNITSAYVRDANVTSYVLKVGVHQINYQYSNGSRQMNLDGGPWQDSSVGSDFTLVNPDGTQKLRMYVRYWTSLPAPSVTSTTLNLTDSIIVTNPSGATLPTCWYRNATAYQVLGQCFNAIGISTQTYDAMDFPFWDSRSDVSYLGLPPDDPTAGAMPTASCVLSDGSIYIAVGLKLYLRSAAAPFAYTLICTSTALVSVIRVLYQASNGYVWMVGSNGKTACWDGSSLHDNLNSAVYGAYSCALVSARPQFLIYVDGAGLLRQVDTQNSVSTISVAGYTPQKWLDSDGTSRIFFTTGSSTINMETYNGSSWVDNGSRSACDYNFLQGAYNATDDAVYFESLSGAVWSIHCAKPIVAGSGSSSAVTTPTAYNLSEFYYNSSDGKVYFLAGEINTSSSQPMYLFTVNLVTGTPTVTAQDASYMPYWIGMVPWTSRSLGYGNSKLFGLNITGQLWQFATSYALSITEAAFPGGTIKDILNGVCRACNLAYVVTPAKAAKIYRRYNNAGSPVTSGNSISLGATVASQLGAVQTYVRAVVYFLVDNGTVKHWYNGSAFDVGFLGSDRNVSLQNTLVPNQLVRDTAYYGYTYLQSDKWKYTIECAAYPAFQYEPFDGAALSFSGKIVVSAAGIIYQSTCRSDGTLVLDVIV